MISLAFFLTACPQKKSQQKNKNEALVHFKVPSVLTVFFLFYTILLLQCSAHSVQSTSQSNTTILEKGEVWPKYWQMHAFFPSHCFL